MLQMGQHLFLSSPLLPSCLLSCAQRTTELLRLGRTSAGHPVQPPGFEEKLYCLGAKKTHQRHLGVKLMNRDSVELP